MSCPTCVNGSCPEVPTTITLENNNIQFNGANAGWREQTSLGSAMVDNISLTLSFYPVDDGAVAVFLNSGVQRQGTDYTVDGNIVTMTAALLDEDEIMVRYFSYDAALASGTVQIGQIIWQASAGAPSGYNAADGATSYTIADYPSLYAHCTTNSLILSETATTFIIVDMTIGPTVGGTTLYGMIKN